MTSARLRPPPPGLAAPLNQALNCGSGGSMWRRDVLIEYSKLMRYQPEPSQNAWCYDGPMVLRQFGPDPNDAADVLETYPWCAAYPSIPSDLSWIKTLAVMYKG